MLRNAFVVATLSPESAVTERQATLGGQGHTAEGRPKNPAVTTAPRFVCHSLNGRLLAGRPQVVLIVRDGAHNMARSQERLRR